MNHLNSSMVMVPSPLPSRRLIRGGIHHVQELVDAEPATRCQRRRAPACRIPPPRTCPGPREASKPRSSSAITRPLLLESNAWNASTRFLMQHLEVCSHRHPGAAAIVLFDVVVEFFSRLLRLSTTRSIAVKHEAVEHRDSGWQWQSPSRTPVRQSGPPAPLSPPAAHP
jgi:hypothetical protein